MTNEQLQRFCGRTGGKYAMDRPFVVDGWMYATDGRIIVRVPTDEPNTTDMKFPNAKPMFDDFPTEWIGWPKTGECIDRVDCPYCWDKEEERCDGCHECGFHCVIYIYRRRSTGRSFAQFGLR